MPDSWSLFTEDLPLRKIIILEGLHTNFGLCDQISWTRTVWHPRDDTLILGSVCVSRPAADQLEYQGPV